MMARATGEAGRVRPSLARTAAARQRLSARSCTPATTMRKSRYVFQNQKPRAEVSPSAAPAPGQPRALPLTFFDLVFSDFPPVQCVFFYGSVEQDLLDVPRFLRRDLPLLKASLAAALHRFYPLAGRLPCEVPAQPEVACSIGRRLCSPHGGGGRR
ncbi:hypothetical protein ZWY2020_023144 [Hordeum vulgare]|nr:hypothetical protein ZWY2020_023144 [Hordeum vulgare]